MPNTDWTAHCASALPYSSGEFAHAKVFLFDKWCDRARLNKLLPPTDLSGSCKYGSLFMQAVFGGVVRGHFEHQYNYIEGRIVDLSHDAADVGRMRNPYLHEPLYFEIPEVRLSLAGCYPSSQAWAEAFLAQRAKSESPQEPAKRHAE
jgi:hypothetical protein